MAMYGYAQTTVSVGTGAGGTTGGSNGTPIYRSSATSSFDYAQSVQLYTQADLNAVGIYSGATISSIGLFKTTAFTMTAGATASLTINMKNSTQAALNTADVFTVLTAGSQVVYQNAAVDNTVIPASTGFVVFPLSTTFTYTGGSIEIGFDWDASSFAGSPSTGVFSWAFDTVPTVQARGTSSSTPITAGLIGVFTRRHQLQATFTGGTICTAPPVGGQTVANFPTACAGLPVVLAVTGDALGTGSSTQWQFSVDNTSYADIAGATLPTYNFTYGAASAGYYQRVETCSAQTGTSAPVQITLFIAATNQAEPFDAYLPTCWTEAAGLLVPSVTFTSTTASNWIADGFLNNGTSGSARIEIWTTTTDEWLISPTYNLTGNEQLVFDLGLTIWNSAAVAGTTGVDDKFAVIISTDDGATWSDANTLRLWDNAGSTNVYNNISNTGETVILDLSTYSGNVKFGFYGESTVSNADNNVYIDNLQVRTAPTCLDITLLATASATNTTANFTWNSNNTGTPGRFEYLIDSANSYPTGPASTVTATGLFAPGNTSASTPIAQSGQVTGLTAATSYDIYLREVCSVSDSSPWTSSVRFITACDPIAAFSENFDGITVPNLPICWSAFNTVLATGTSPSVITSAAADNSLPNGVSLQSASADGTTITADLLLISPVLSNLSAGTNRLRFFLDASVATSSVQVGTMTDPADPSTFTAITTIAATTAWVEHTVNFDTYAGTDTYIAFKHIFTTTFDNLYIDDIVWEAIPACQEPTSFAVAAFTDTTVNLSWINANTSTVSSIEYGALNFVLGTGTVVVGQANTAVVAGLTPETVYQFYVTQDCSTASDGLSVVVGPINIITACAAVAAPYTVDFDSFVATTAFASENCWTETSAGAFTWDLDAGGPTGSSLTGPSGAFTGTKYFFTESSSGTYGDTASLRTPLVNLSGLTNPSLMFYTHLYGGAIGTFEVFAIVNGVETSVFAVTGQQQTIEADPWDQRIVDLVAFAGQTIAIEFRHTTANSGTGFSYNGDAALDDVSFVELPQCIDVTAIAVSAITATSAQIAWTDNSTLPATTWEVVVQAAGTAAPSTGAANATANPFAVTGLTSSTAYDVYVRAVCSNTFTGPVSFTTAASCGDTIYDTGGASGNYSANENYTVTYFPDTAGNVVTLNFTLVDLETCCDDLEVFDGTDVTATAFTTDLIAPESFRATNAAGAITIRFTSDSSVQGAGWAATYTCAAPPSCLEPTALTATTITDTTAQLSWTESNATAATLWDIEIVAAGTAPTGTPTNAGVSNPFNVTGLTAVTAYDYYVRAACSTTSFSTYAGPFSFTTTASCGDTIYDTGGASGNYSANESYTVTYFPDTAGNVVTLNFTLVDLENCCDDLEVFDGIDVTATAFTTDLIAPESFRATNAAGAITIRFTSDSSVQGAGWAATYTCAAPPSCLEPTALTATTITDTTAQLSWTESNATAATLWDIEIVAAGTAPTGTPTNAGASNPFNATGLSADTAYDFYVRAACSTTDFSPYSGPVSFRTRCAAVTTFPVTTDFTTNVPNTCWSEAGGGELAAGPSGLGASDWGANRAYTNAAGTVVPSNRLNLYQNVDREWLISETYDLSGGTYNLAVEVAVTNYTFSGTSSPTSTDTMGSDDSVILAVSADNGTTWSALTTWDVNNQPAVTGTEFFADLSAFTGNVQFAFLGSDGTVSDPEDYDFHIGSFRIETTAGTNDTALAASLSLYPNPVTGDELNITFSQSSQDAVNVTIVNMTGQVLRAQRFDQVAGIVQLNDMARLASGVYFVNVTQGAQVATLKFIKQ
jgi:hypothetical protein